MPSSESDHRRSPSPNIDKDDMRHTISSIRNESRHDRSRSRTPERRTERSIQQSPSKSPPPRHRSIRDDSRDRRQDDRQRGRSRSRSKSKSQSPQRRFSRNSRSPPPAPSRFRSPLPPQEETRRRQRNDSPGRERHRGDNNNRRRSPSYDRYRPVRRDEGNRGNHRDDRDRYSGGGGGGGGNERGHRGDDYTGNGRRGGPRDGPGAYGGSHMDQRNGDGQRNEDNYRGGRRPQEAMKEFSDSRRDMRIGIKFSIWAASPTAEELRNRSPSPDREVKKKADKSKKHDSDSDSDRSDKDRKRRRKSKRSKEGRSSSRHRSSRHKSSRRSTKRSRRSPSPLSEGEDERRSQDKSRRDRNDSVEAASTVAPPAASSDIQKQFAHDDDETEFPDDMWVEKKVEMPEDDQEVGPTPLYLNDHNMNERNYGGALLAGEGSAMAAYVQDGKRIPRRGEIGLESDQIEHYEHSGFVMSGSRHQRMNAVRVRKENQVISAEEKRALLIFNQEEKIKKDNKIINEMREMVASKLRSTGHSV